MLWTILNSRYVYDKKPYMTLREDTVLLPNGTQIDDFFVFEYPDWVCVLPITESGDIVLVKQYRHGIGAVHHELVAGVVDPDEDKMLAAQRELLEETGYGGGNWEYWMQASANPATHTNLCHIYLAKGVTLAGRQQLDHTEDIEVDVLSPEAVRQLLLHGGIMQALHCAALWKYFGR